MISAYSSLSGKDRRAFSKSKIMVPQLSQASRTVGHVRNAEGSADAVNSVTAGNGVWWDDVLGQAESADIKSDSTAEDRLESVSETAPVTQALSVEDELLADLSQALSSDEDLAPAVSDSSQPLLVRAKHAAEFDASSNQLNAESAVLNAEVVPENKSSTEEYRDLSVAGGPKVGSTSIEATKSTAPGVPVSRGPVGFGASAPVALQPVAAALVPPSIHSPLRSSGPVVLPFSPIPAPLPMPVASIEATDLSLRNQLVTLLSSAGMPALRNVDVFVERGVISIRAVVANPVLFPAPQASVTSPVLFPVAAPFVSPPLQQFPAVGVVPIPGWVAPVLAPASVAAATHVNQEAGYVGVSKTRPEHPVQLPDPALYEVSEDAHEISPVSLSGDTALKLSAETDEAIRDRIVASLVATNIPTLAELEVIVEGQSVTLQGVVTSQYERQMVLQMVKRECDAWHVRNGINVVPPKALRFSLREFSKDLWSSYRIELSVIACSLIAILGVIVPWPKWAPATTYQMNVSAMLGQEPMTGAVISLHPDGWSLPEDAVPTGRVGADGKVVFTTFTDRDGVPAGEYSVTASWNKLVTLPGGESVRGPNVVPEIYRDPATSPLKIKVESNVKELPALEFAKK